MKDRNAETITEAWRNLNKDFELAGVSPEKYVLDNEASSMLKVVMHDKKIKHQLVTPHSHRTNMSKRAIHKFKHHFKAILASVDP